MPLKPEGTGPPPWSSSDPWTPIGDRAPPAGAYPVSPNPSFTNVAHKSINEVVKARKDEFVRKKTIKIKVGTWNVAAMHDTYKDLGAWFAEGLGVKGLTQHLAGLSTGKDDTSDEADYDSDIESVAEQEARHRKKNTTLPRHDHPALASGKEVDLYVLGLQEVLDVSSVAETMRPYTDPNPAKKWKRALRKHLPTGYKKIVEEQLIGLLLLVFASPRLAPDISSVDSTHVGTGLMGYLGNKGAASARILIGETTRILFVNCHLAAGADATALQRRIWDTQQIVSRTKFHPVGGEWVGGIGQSESIGDEDIAFWFGDLNYRLDDIPGEDVRRLLLLHARNEYDILNRSKRRIDSELGYLARSPNDQADDRHDEEETHERSAAASRAEPILDPESDPASLLTTLKSLLTHDQLHAQQRAGKAFHEGWREGEINFLPTYKYDVGSVAMFDSGEKKRSPSWCDRILYRTRADYENYFRKLKVDSAAQKRDEEMKKNGLDDAASQEDILFNYDPEADGDDYDDDVEQHDNDGDVELIRTQEGFEDTLILDEYISHQRVLSSDHKPLSAVFTLTYDSVDPVLKAKIQSAVTKEFDKAENEARPKVTLVLDNQSFSSAVTDKSSDAPELKLVAFGGVRYHVRYEHRLTIANTGPVEAVFAFMDRGTGPTEGPTAGPIPSWLKVEIRQNPDTAKVAPPDLSANQRYRLSPGETTNIDLLVEIVQPETIKQLNSGELVLDDILVLRISNSRDYFIPIRGQWLQTCFYRSVDELVKVPSGVRSLSLKHDGAEIQQQPPTNAVHSAPPELFALTDIIPKLVERVVAEWTMLNEDEVPPWLSDSAWPFGTSSETDRETRDERLAEIREALDTAYSLDEHLSPTADPAERLSLLAETLTSFLTSLSDGIVVVEVWQVIESKMQGLEKARTSLTTDSLNEIVMDAISVTPIHSVSLTFINFMLSQLISEICADEVQHERSLPVGRSRSSTSASTMSDVSLSSVKSAGSSRAKPTFLSSITQRATGSNMVTTPISPMSVEADAMPLYRAQLARKYAEIFAPLVIRSDDTRLKAKEKKTQLARKVRALESLLIQQP